MGYDLSPMKRMKRTLKSQSLKSQFLEFFYLFKSDSKSACFITTKEGDCVYFYLVQVSVVSLFFEGSLVPD